MSDSYKPEVLHSRAQARLEAVVAEWEAAGSPLLANGSMGQLVEHPLVKMIREHEHLVSKLGELVRKRHVGPQPSAVLGLGVSKSRSATLRLAKAEERDTA